MSIALGNVTTTSSAMYTSSGNTAITFMSICNYSASPVIANVWVVPNGDTAANTNIVLASLPLAAGNAGISGGDTYQFYGAGEKLLLGNGDAIHANGSANNAITIVTSYTSL